MSIHTICSKCRYCYRSQTVNYMTEKMQLKHYSQPLWLHTIWPCELQTGIAFKCVFSLEPGYGLLRDGYCHKILYK